MTVHPLTGSFVPRRLTAPCFGGQGSASPRVAVVENNDRPTIDIDGDGTPDLTHTDVVERIIKAYCPQALLERYSPAGQKLTSGIIAQQVDRLGRALANGTRYAAVNLSLGKSDPISLAPDAKDGLSPENLRSLRPMLVETLGESDNPPAKAMHRMIQALESLVNRHRLPLYIAAGNDGPRHFNLLSLADGVINVGATNAVGQKEGYSCNHSLIDRWEQGTYNVTPVKGGFDITGNGVADVLNSEVSGGAPRVKRYVGKPLKDVLATREEILHIWEQVSQQKPMSEITALNQRLLPLELMRRLDWISENTYQIVKTWGDYADFAEGRIHHVYRTDDSPQRRVRFSPDGSDRVGAVSFVWGTSFAAPAALGKDLQQAQDTTAKAS